jgi:DNA polymerase (family X)
MVSREAEEKQAGKPPPSDSVMLALAPSARDGSGQTEPSSGSPPHGSADDQRVLVPHGAPTGRNARIAQKLRQAAELLAAHGADSFRINAYRRAADSIGALTEDLGALAARGGKRALEAIPGIGVSIAGAISEILATGRWSFLDHLEGGATPEELFQTIPGVGPQLAHRLHETLNIRTLQAFEAAAHDGRLKEVPGFGRRRREMVRRSLAEILAPIRRQAAAPGPEPPIDVLLEVDSEYRQKAAAGELPKIAPKRFNPTGEAWLPILHTVRGSWRFTALFSNTARAHDLGRSGDWVVIYFHHDTEPEGQRTVVTETRGGAAGRRVVRGREEECRQHYAAAGREGSG